MDKILNLTQHPASDEQLAVGVIELPEMQRKEVKALLTFEEVPSHQVLRNRAFSIASYAVERAEGAMIGGAPFLMPDLESALHWYGIDVHYAFSKRESVEKVINGEVVKTSIFKHQGFVVKPCERRKS